MTELPSYAIAGRGRWAKRMEAILAADGRRVVASVTATRRGDDEQEHAYRDRLCSSFTETKAQIAWICIPPGDCIPLMVEAALNAGLHVLVEKPWLCSPEITKKIEAFARSRKLIVAVHYEYCMLEQVQAWRKEWHPGTGFQFHGRMKVSRPNHTGIPALENLGSHLFSIQEYCVPTSTISEMDCAYEQPDERCVWIERQGKRVAEIDLLNNREPIIQRFIAAFESATQGREFPFDLQFASRVSVRMSQWERQNVG